MSNSKRRKGGRLVPLTPQEKAKRKAKRDANVSRTIRKGTREARETVKRAEQSGLSVAFNLRDALKKGKPRESEFHASPDPKAAADAERALREGTA